MKNPLIVPLAAGASGILLSRFIYFDLLEVVVVLTLLFALTLIAVKYSKALIRPCTLLVLLVCGLLVDVLHRAGRAPEIDAGSRERVLLSGCVVQPSVFFEGRDQFTVELAPRARARVSLMIRDGQTPPDLRYGQQVEFEARVRAIRNFQNPGAFDYAGYSARSHIYWTASVGATNVVKILPGRCGSRVFAAIFGLRTAALRRIEELYPNNAYATGVMEATLIGDTTKLEKIWTDHFRRTGTYHMLVIDGLHITILAAFLLFLLRVAMVPELTAIAITAAGAWLYAMVSGGNAPAVRAAGGFTLYVIARYFYRRGRMLNLLAALGIVYLIYDPGQLFDAGFQLSFLAVAAIGALAMPLLESTSTQFSNALRDIQEVSRDPRISPKAAQFRVELRLLAETAHYYLRIPQAWILRMLVLIARVSFYIYEMAVITTAIQIGVALPMAIYFHRIPLTGLSANVLVVPLLGLVVPIGFVAIFSGWHFPAMIAERLLMAGEKVADWHTHLEPQWRVLDPPLWLSIAFSAVLLLLAFSLWRKWRRRTMLCAAAMLPLFLLILLHPFPPLTQRGELEVTAIDVGQGDSLLVAFPTGKLMLIDGGGILSFGQHRKARIEIGEDIVSPYLWSRSIGKIDIVAMTHAHEDHAQGLPAIIENFHPAELWTGAQVQSAAWSAVKEKAETGKVKIVSMRSGQAFEFGGARVEILSPAADYAPSDVPKNDDSLAMRITYGERSFLLTGDMEKPAEFQLLASGSSLHADVLKVGHHGSNTSSVEPFLDAVSPTFAVISDGFENTFRHPHPLVLQRLADHHAGVLRTDQDGLVTIRTDGHRMSVETFRLRTASHLVYPPSSSSALPY